MLGPPSSVCLEPSLLEIVHGSVYDLAMKRRALEKKLRALKWTLVSSRQKARRVDKRGWEQVRVCPQAQRDQRAVGKSDPQERRGGLRCGSKDESGRTVGTG